MNNITNGKNSKEIIGIGIAGIVAILMLLSTLAVGVTAENGSESIDEGVAPEGAFGSSGSTAVNNFFMINNFTITPSADGDNVICGDEPEIGAELVPFIDYQEMYVENIEGNGEFDCGETILTDIVEIDFSDNEDDYDNETIIEITGENYKYTDNDNNGSYTYGEAIIWSENDVLENGDNIIRSGVAAMINAEDTNLAYYDEDGDGAFTWKTDVLYYDADGDLEVDADDNRYGEKVFTSGSGSLYARLEADDLEIGQSFDDDVNDNQIGWINTSDSSKPGIDGGDLIFVDTNNNEVYDENDVLLLDHPDNGLNDNASGFTYNIEWETGRYDNYPAVLIDVGDDGFPDLGENDIAISNGDVDVGIPGSKITGTPSLITGEVLMSLDLDIIDGYSANERVYVAVDDDDEVSEGDYRLTYWEEAFGEAGQWTAVSEDDLDMGLDLTAFVSAADVWFTDNNHDDSYTVGGSKDTREAVIDSTDSTLDNLDQVLISGLADIQGLEAVFVDANDNDTREDNEDILLINVETGGPYNNQIIRNFADNVKHDESEYVNGEYDNGESIVIDADNNGAYKERLDGLTVTNMAPSPTLSMGHIAGFILVKDNGDQNIGTGDNAMLIAENMEKESVQAAFDIAKGQMDLDVVDNFPYGVSWINNKTAKLTLADGLTPGVPQSYYLFTVLKKGIGGYYNSQFRVTSIDTAGDMPFTPFTNDQMQYVTGQPLDKDVYMPGDNVDIHVYDQSQNVYPNMVEELVVSVYTYMDNDDTRDMENVLLTETGPSTGLFTGCIPLVGENVETGTGPCGYPETITENAVIGDNKLFAESGDMVVLRHGVPTYYPFTRPEINNTLIDTALVDFEAPVLENFRAACSVENKFINPGRNCFWVDVNEEFGWEVEFYQDDTYFDNDSGVGHDNAKGCWDGMIEVICTQDNTEYTVERPALDGYYEFTAKAWDAQEQMSSLSKTYIIDNTAPKVVSTSADPYYVDNDHPSDITLTVDATDNVIDNIEGSGVSEVWVDIGPILCDNGIWRKMDKNESTGLWEYTFHKEDWKVAFKKKYYLDVWTVDKMGGCDSANEDNSAGSIVVEMVDDNDDPVLENVAITYPNEQASAINTQTVTVTADASDPTTLIKNVVINAENLGLGTAITMEHVSGNTYEENLTIDTDNTGNMQISLTANDVAKNSTTVTETVLVENQITSYVIDLEEGWNLISFPLIIENPSIENIMAGLEGATMDNIATIQTYVQKAGDEPGEWLTYEPDVPSEADFLEMEDGKGYWIKMDTSATLTIHGSQQPTGAGEVAPPAYQFYEGWNLVGFTSVYSMEVGTYLDDVADVVDTWTAANFNPATGRLYTMASYSELQPGAGYWVHVNEYAELPYGSWLYD